MYKRVVLSRSKKHLLVNLLRSFIVLFITHNTWSSEIIAQYRDLKFVHITVNEGLSSSDVYSILQDNNGFIWFGTYDGLDKFDGTSIKIYRHINNDPSSLLNNYIFCMYKDYYNQLWYGTQAGLSRYNNSLDNFINYALEKDYAGRDISLNRIRGIDEDNQHNIYVVNERGGLYKFDKNKNDFVKLAESKTADIVYTMAIDDNDIAWIGSSNGLYCYDIKNKLITEYNKKGTTKFYINDIVTTIFVDKDILWVGTLGSGLKNVNLKTGKIKQFKTYNDGETRIYNIFKDNNENFWIGNADGLKLYDKTLDKFWSYNFRPNDKYSLMTAGVRSVFEDSQGNIFASSCFGGVNIAYLDKAFLHLRNNSDLPLKLTRDIVSSIMMDEHNNLWVGSFNGGIDVINLVTYKNKHYEHVDGNPYSLGSSTIGMIFRDSKNNIWVGSFNGGLQQYDMKNDRFIPYVTKTIYPELKYDDVRSMTEDKQGNLWLITHGCGAVKFNPVTKEFHHYTKSSGFPADWGFTLFIDKDNQLWEGTPSGLGKVANDGHTIKIYQYESKNIHSISNNMVKYITEDSRNNIWVGTDDGLNLFNKKTEKFYRLFKNDGLPNSAIKAIQEDNSGNIWVSTNKGMSRISIFTSKDSLQFKFKNFDISDGLQGDEFIDHSTYKNPQTGQLFFGGVNGITTFYPDSIKENPYIPPIVFTDFKIFNQSARIGEKNSPLKKQINETETIKLKYWQNFITIEYAALNFVIPEKNQYAYMLEGIDNTWNYVKNEHKATYANLSPGNYVFRVKASNNDGLWNEKGISLKIHISSPLWLTGWAIALYILIIIGILYYIFMIFMAEEKIKSEAYLERLEAKKTHELDAMKIQFFTNLSHELRTPLTLILGPIQKLLKEGTGNEQQTSIYNMVYKNANRLYQIINQLLDFRRIEAGYMKLEVNNDDIIRFTEVIAGAFNYMANQRNIKYSIHSSINSLKAWFDPDKLDKILNNLISNAFKYSADGSEINIHLSTGQYPRETGQIKYFIIIVKDSGFGIPEESLKNLFTLFYKAQDHKNPNSESSGIGLSLTKELVNIHKGHIEVNSEVGKGSVFTVYLPYEKDCYKPDEIVERNINLDQKLEKIAFDPIIKETHESSNGTENNNLPLALIIEDFEDVRKYIKDSLAGSFRVIEAKDGEEGYIKALSEIPDIIISDIIMPVMDGFTLCSKLKNDFRVSHVPIILLTAKDSEENKKMGFEAGADDYITKPFNADLLLARINNLLHSRIKLKEVFGKTNGHNPNLVELNHNDKMFIDKALRVVENHLADTNFNINVFANEMKISRIQLYRKFSAITKQTVYEFIQNIKFKKATDMLVHENKSVSEVANAIGYTEATNFIRAFSKHFGVTPSKYTIQKRKRRFEI